MTEILDILDKLDFFNRRAGRELWRIKPESIQDKDIQSLSSDIKKIRDFIARQQAEIERLQSMNQAKLAFDKLTGVKEYNYETNKSEDETEKIFVPHLESIYTDVNHEKIGEETNFVDAVDRRLYIGDIVEIFDCGKLLGERVVAEYEREQFIVGIRGACNDKNGTIEEKWKILKKRSYKDVKNGETIGGIKFVTENYYNGKLVCIDDDGSPYWTVGKIYECVNGVLDSNKRVSYAFRKYESLEHINKCCGAKFIELKI